MKKSKAMCAGCEDDFYNDKNPYGVKECWSYKTAEVKPRVQIHVDQPPPYRQKPQKMLSCYRVKRCVFVSPDALKEDGYWR